MVKIHSITFENVELLIHFIQNLGKSKLNFRYFNKRSTSVIKNHKVTLIITNKNDKPVCYGHLDDENGVIWLGISVIEGEEEKGYGKLMMKALLEYAKENNILKIYLSVDKSNIRAMSLYEKHGFKKTEEGEGYYIYTLN
jgi:RimJ/RimL family protein N-acetyltransferase